MFCRQQLADFQARLDEFEERDALVFAASVDDREEAEKIVSDLGLRFPVGFGLPAVETAQRLGAFYHAKRQFLHATGYLISPEGTVRNAVYSTGSLGRFTPADALRLLDHFLAQ